MNRYVHAIFTAAVLVVMAGLFSFVTARPPHPVADGPDGARQGWYAYAENARINTTAEIMSTDTLYTHLAANDSLEVVAVGAAGTFNVLVVGTAADSSRVQSYYRVSGTDTVTSTQYFLAVEYVVIDSGQAPTDTLKINRATGNTHLSQINPGRMVDATCHKFFNNSAGFISGWGAGVRATTGTVEFELRLYPDLLDARDLTDDYVVLDRISLANALVNFQRAFPQPLLCPRYSYVAVFATGGANASSGYASIYGYNGK